MVLATATAWAGVPVGLLHLDGKVLVKGARVEGTVVVVMENDGPVDVLTKELAHFQHTLPLQSIYLLSFEHEGYVTKQLYFDTHVPAEALAHAPFDFPFQVTLEATPKDAPFEYEGPVGFIRYYKEERDFGYDTDYSRKMDPALAERMRNRYVEGTTPSASETSTSSFSSSAAPPTVSVPREVDEARFLNIRTPLLRSTAPSTSTRKPIQVVVQGPMVTEASAESHPRKIASDPKVERKEAPAPKKVEPITVPSIKPLAANAGPDTIVATVQPDFHQEASSVVVGASGRSEELIVEKRRVIRIVRITTDGHTAEYRRVTHQFGQVFYFKDGESCSQWQYEHETAVN
jgi:hypothetical protein